MNICIYIENPKAYAGFYQEETHARTYTHSKYSKHVAVDKPTESEPALTDLPDKYTPNVRVLYMHDSLTLFLRPKTAATAIATAQHFIWIHTQFERCVK